MRDSASPTINDLESMFERIKNTTDPFMMQRLFLHLSEVIMQPGYVSTLDNFIFLMSSLNGHSVEPIKYQLILLSFLYDANQGIYWDSWITPSNYAQVIPKTVIELLGDSGKKEQNMRALKLGINDLLISCKAQVQHDRAALRHQGVAAGGAAAERTSEPSSGGSGAERTSEPSSGGSSAERTSEPSSGGSSAATEPNLYILRWCIIQYYVAVLGAAPDTPVAESTLHFFCCVMDHLQCIGLPIPIIDSASQPIFDAFLSNPSSAPHFALTWDTDKRQYVETVPRVPMEDTIVYNQGITPKGTLMYKKGGSIIIEITDRCNKKNKSNEVLAKRPISGVDETKTKCSFEFHP